MWITSLYQHPFKYYCGVDIFFIATQAAPGSLPIRGKGKIRLRDTVSPDFLEPLNLVLDLQDEVAALPRKVLMKSRIKKACLVRKEAWELVQQDHRGADFSRQEPDSHHLASDYPVTNIRGIS
jgi:hypothetical protein